MKKPQTRVLGIDIIKVIAVIFVISIHQIAKTHVLSCKMDTAYSFFIILFRYIVMACVPLFLMSTGYLQSRKKLKSGYYRGLIPIIFIYIITSIITSIVKTQYDGEEFNFGMTVLNIFNFTENDYVWYVEMFIGLYIFIPFLNYMYHGIEIKRHKRLLIFTLIFMTAAPSIATLFSNNVITTDVLPDYWVLFYPVTYYMIGAYIREFNLRTSRIFAFIMILISALIPTAVEFIFYNGQEFNANVMNGFHSMASCLIAFFIFQLFYNVNSNSKIICAIFKDISSMTLEIYLISNAVEIFIYPLMPVDAASMISVMIPVVFIISYICAKIIHIPVKIITKLIK